MNLLNLCPHYQKDLNLAQAGMFDHCMFVQWVRLVLVLVHSLAVDRMISGCFWKEIIKNGCMKIKFTNSILSLKCKKHCNTALKGQLYDTFEII